jgi:hypothetical protein
MFGYIPHRCTKWRILLGICLAIAVCVPMVSTAIQVPTTQYSFNRPQFEQINVAKDIPYTFGNDRKPDMMPVIQITDSSKKNWKSAPFADMTLIESSNSIFDGLGAPRTISHSHTYITEEEAIAIALARYPDIVLLQPIKATLKRINAPAYPLATNPCWEVEIIGINPYEGVLVVSDTGEKSTGIYTCYGGILIIDAVTGKIFYKLIPASDYVEVVKDGK